MLEEISVKNFLSFNEEVSLSFEATTEEFGENNLVVTMPDGKRLLRFAMIYGANASGKTNVLMAMDTLKRFWRKTPEDIDKSTGIVPFRFDVVTPSKPSEFTIRFYVDGVRYWYVLRVNTKRVVEEKLSYYASNRPTMLFHRKMEDDRLNLSINHTVLHVSEVERQQIQINCFDNMSFFAARSKVNIQLPEIDVARKWMIEQVMNPVLPGQSMFEYAKNQVEKDSSLIPYLLEKMGSADFNITGLQTERKPSDFPKEVIQEIREDKDLSEEEKKDLLTSIQANFEHTVSNSRGKEKYVLEDTLESRGTKRVLGMEIAMYKAHLRKALLPVDELETSLHPALIEEVIYDFLKTYDESQLLITTHYDFLLDLINDLIRKDCVWFTEKGADGATALYSLAEFAGLNKLKSLQRAYRGGRFGAIPNIG